jgi:hypothetical protein
VNRSLFNGSRNTKRFTTTIPDSRFATRPNAVGTTSHLKRVDHNGRCLDEICRPDLFVNRITIHDLANAGWEYMVKAASKPARPRYKGGTLTDFVANLQSTKYERQLCAECRWNYIHVKDEVPGSNPGGPPKINEGHSSIG